MTKKIEYSEGKKVCTCCKQEKPLAEFSIRKERNNQPYSNCKKCQSIKALEWNRSNKEKFSINGAIYYQKNKEKILSKIDKEKRNINKEIWRLANLDKDAAKSSKRRAIKKSNQPIFSSETKVTLVFTQCKILEQQTGKKHHVDHIVPLKSKFVCGLHCENNLQILPAEENLRKHNSFWPDMPDLTDKELQKLAKEFYA